MVDFISIWDKQEETVKYNTIQYNTIQYNTIQYNTIQYNTIQYYKTQHNRLYDWEEQSFQFGHHDICT